MTRTVCNVFFQIEVDSCQKVNILRGISNLQVRNEPITAQKELAI